MGLLNEALELSKLDTLSGDKLSDVGQAVTELENVRSKVSDLEQEIKNLKAREEQLENDIIPSFFDTGIQQLTLKDGSKITVKDKTRAHIREDNEDYCFQWLRNQGLDDVIKNQVISTFGRGQDSDAQNLVKELEENHGVEFLESDFKKHGGYMHSIELSKKHNLYRQDYCGCLYSRS